MDKNGYETGARDGYRQAPSTLLQDSGYMDRKPPAERPTASIPSSINAETRDGSVYSLPVDQNNFNASLASLGRTTGFRMDKLSLKQTTFGDSGVSTLRTMPNIRELELDDTNISDRGLAQLSTQGMRNLHELSLHSTGITDKGTSYLRSLPLQELNLNDTAITDQTIRNLRGMHLSVLNLGHTAITDHGLRHIKDLPDLRVLSLEGADISERGLDHITRSRRLQVLNLKDTQLSNDSIQRLQRKMPTTLIVKPDGTW